jgi:hypothetical protein
VSSRGELSGLSSHDIWALDSFANRENKVPKEVGLMNAPQRVAARTLLDLNLLTLVGEGASRHVTVTALGHLILETAKSLPL